MAWNPEDLTNDVMGRAVRGFAKGGIVLPEYKYDEKFRVEDQGAGGYISPYRGNSGTNKDVATFLSIEGVYEKLVDISTKYGFALQDLVGTIAGETGWTFSPEATSGNSGAVGLIQFNNDQQGPGKDKNFKTIGNKEYYIDDIADMSELQQLDLVDKYFEENHPKKDGKYVQGLPPSITVAFPKAHTMGMDDVISRPRQEGEKKGLRDNLRTQNPSWVNEEGVITKRSIMSHYGWAGE